MTEVLIGIFALVIGLVVGYRLSEHLNTKEEFILQKKVNKYREYYAMINQWLMLKQEGVTLEKYFIDNHYKTVAIYGMGELGTRFYNELKDSAKVEVKYAVDKNVAGTYSELPVRKLEKPLDDIDVIVVTAVFDFDEIEKLLKKVTTAEIISLDDVIFEIL